MKEQRLKKSNLPFWFKIGSVGSTQINIKALGKLYNNLVLYGGLINKTKN